MHIEYYNYLIIHVEDDQTGKPLLYTITCICFVDRIYVYKLIIHWGLLTLQIMLESKLFITY